MASRAALVAAGLSVLDGLSGLDAPGVAPGELAGWQRPELERAMLAKQAVIVRATRTCASVLSDDSVLVAGDQLIDRQSVGMIIAVRANDERRDHQIVGRRLIDVLAGLNERKLDRVSQ